MESAHGYRQKHGGHGQINVHAQAEKKEATPGAATARLRQQTALKAAAIAAVIVGVLGRLWQLPAVLWYDEAFSSWLANLPRLDMLINATASDVHPPAYYAILWAWVRLAGHSEIALRIPSFLAGIGVIFAVYAMCRALRWPTATTMLAVILAALSPQQIYYSSEVRNYEIVTLGLTLAALGLITRRYWLAIAGSLLALYLHHVAVLFVGAVWLAGMHRNRRYWLAALATGLLWLPNVVLFAVSQTGSITGNYWMPPLRSPGMLLSVLDDLYWFQPGSPLALATAVVTTMLICLILADLPRHNTRFAWIALFTPLAALAILSLAWQPILVGRSMAPAAPFLIMLAAYTITQSRRRIVAFSILGGPVLAATLALLLVGYMGRAPVDHAMAAKLRQYDAIYHANVGSYVVWKYYLPDMPQYVWPQSTSLAQTLTTETRQAMAMDEIDWQFIKCVNLVDYGNVHKLRRWAFIYFNNPATMPGEVEFVNNLLQTTPHRNIEMFRDDVLADSGLVELLPVCGQ